VGLKVALTHWASGSKVAGSNLGLDSDHIMNPIANNRLAV
jgi:hypothetical protein